MKINKVMFKIMRELEFIGFKIIMIRQVEPYIYIVETEVVKIKIKYYKSNKRSFISIQYIL